jgi:hypothetical protein
MTLDLSRTEYYKALVVSEDMSAREEQRRTSGWWEEEMWRRMWMSCKQRITG